MDKDKTIERIKSCMVLEAVCSSVYHLLSLNFPRESELWNKLAIDEETHAEIIAKGMEIKEEEDIEDFAVPGEFEYVRNAVDYAKEFKKMLIKDKASIKDVFEMATKLLEMKNDGYTYDLIGMEKEERVKNVFIRLYDMDRSKLDMVRTAMTRYGFRGAAAGN